MCKGNQKPFSSSHAGGGPSKDDTWLPSQPHPKISLIGRYVVWLKKKEGAW
jgi:hypothetical protein